MVTSQQLVLLVVAGIGGLSGLAALVNAVFQRRKVGADATVVVVAAARELVDPLRRELATERADHVRELALAEQQVLAFRREMEQAINEARELRVQLAIARREADELRTRIHDLEAERGHGRGGGR